MLNGVYKLLEHVCSGKWVWFSIWLWSWSYYGKRSRNHRYHILMSGFERYIYEVFERIWRICSFIVGFKIWKSFLEFVPHFTLNLGGNSRNLWRVRPCKSVGDGKVLGHKRTAKSQEFNPVQSKIVTGLINIWTGLVFNFLTPNIFQTRFGLTHFGVQ